MAAECSHLMDQYFPFITYRYRRNTAEKSSTSQELFILQSGSAGSQIIGFNTSHLYFDIKMPCREFAYF
jgi:hypothetical protein